MTLPHNDEIQYIRHYHRDLDQRIASARVYQAHLERAAKRQAKRMKRRGFWSALIAVLSFSPKPKSSILR